MRLTLCKSIGTAALSLSETPSAAPDAVLLRF